VSADEITLPRAIVEQLVDPQTAGYIDYEYSRCAYCEASASWDKGLRSEETTPHAASCPVRLTQDALREQP
jgi:hypothetical protein